MKSRRKSRNKRNDQLKVQNRLILDILAILIYLQNFYLLKIYLFLSFKLNINFL